MRSEELVVFFIASLVIIAGVAIIWQAMYSRRLMREMAHRERLAMIDRGLVPPPEVDPAGFERRLNMRPPQTRSSSRARSAGVTMIGLGLAFMFFFTFAVSEPGIGFGIGGAFALLGATFFVNALLGSRHEEHWPPATTYPPPAYRADAHRQDPYRPDPYRQERRDPPPPQGQ